MALIAAHVNAEVTGDDSVALGITSLFPTSRYLGPCQYLFENNWALSKSNHPTTTTVSEEGTATWDTGGKGPRSEEEHHYVTTMFAVVHL